MFVLKITIRKKQIFHKPSSSKAPPLWIRSILVLTSTGVSFSHGSNDGQKGVGLVMMILIGIVPGFFAVNLKKNPSELNSSITKIEIVMHRLDASVTSLADNSVKENILLANNKIDSLKTIVCNASSFKQIPETKHFEIRKDILLIAKTVDKILASLEGKDNIISTVEKADLKKNISAIKTTTEYAPWWVILMISLSLGIGTMVGWKRIVITIGEKIGKTHMNYAQGAASQLVAASTISASSLLGLPVSTTHVLSSGIAGSMVAQEGMKNLQGKTLKNMGLAWLVTLPVTTVLSGTLFLLFRWIL
ncbi:MAG: inorganic phosphate transporter [Bacteroidota bacterium]